MEEKMSLLLKNGRVLLPDGRIATLSLVLAGGRIHSLGVEVPANETLDVRGSLIVPGFIDLHTHGCGRESALDDLGRFAEEEARWGVTTFFPTLFCPPASAMDIMRRHLAAGDGFRQLPQVGGFRLESPYLAGTGGGQSGDLAPISRDLTDRLLEAGGGHIAIWDISPELPGAAEVIRDLTEQGIVCSLAHTRATIDQARAAVRAGARLVTHLFDVFPLPAAPSPETGVYPAGLVDYLLIEDRLACEIIPDGTHVHPLLVEMAFRCKSQEGLVFISDSNFGAGLPPGEYDLPQGRGRVVISGPNDGLRLADRGLILAGSALTPAHGFRNALELFGKDLATASRVCSRNPARLLGLNKGAINPGYDADLVVLDGEFRVLYTIVAGRVVYENPERPSVD